MENKLRVAYFLHRFPYLTETFIMREMYWIREQGVEISVFSLLNPKPGPVHDQAKQLLRHVHYSPFLSRAVIEAQLHFIVRSPWRYLRALVKTIGQTYREPGVLLRALALFPKSVYFARQVDERKIDHIHAHFAWLEGIAAGVASELLGITFTIHPHAFDLFERNQQDVRSELETASKIVTVSEYHRAYIAALCRTIRPDDIAVVHYGLETDRFRPPDRRISGTSIRILAVGRLIEKKGHEYLIDACALLDKRTVDFECRIVGGGPLREALQARIDQHGLQSKVILVGALDQAAILALYHTSTIFALPCVVARSGDRDGMPVALIEAMACGLPVVTTPVTGIPELVDNEATGLLVKERDAAELASALGRLIADEPLRTFLGERARQRILEGFQIQDKVAELAAIFREVRARRQHPTKAGNDATIRRV